MKNKENFPKAANEQLENKDGYPKYPENEAIYNKFDKEFDINPENISKKKPTKIIDEDPEWNEIDIDLEHPGADLDVLGSEFDDEQEVIKRRGK
ncbi:hypothetical protein [Flavobacterium cellulosilyticum]|uniref:Uncharacterized protein n=1 Tax=Flavobacterium cellulosilyticum TaxID=2541731 RepID=A0A4R5CBX4_9FLAO|nr:hypothetical protein [Flavobacterium cellulosilyticum]TDD97458.1 hypothetical protein E0F76_09125 [Flavobacterium cellulosilyticum]